MKWSDVLKLLIGLSIIAFLIHKIGFTEVYTALVNMNIIYLPVVFGLYLFSFFFEALSFKMLTLPLIDNISIKKLYCYSVLAWALALFAPGRLGDLSMIYFLKREGVEVGQATFVTMANRLVAFVVLSMLSIAGFFHFFGIGETLKLIALLFMLFTSVSFWFLSNTGRDLVKRYILRGHSMKFKGFSKTLDHYLKNHKKMFLVIFFMILSKWAVLSTIVFLIFVSFGTTISLLSVIFISAMVTIVSLLPITPAGLGIREAGAVFLYGGIGLPPSITIGVYMVLNVLNYVVGIGSIATLSNHLKMPNIKNIIIQKQKDV